MALSPRPRALLTPRLRPTWSWDFRRGALPPGSTYSGSGGTSIGADGLIAARTPNVPRFDHDPSTRTPLGYLAEMASTNALPYSRAFTAPGWSAYDISVTDNDQVAPDGSMTAARFVESSATAAHVVEFNTINVVQNGIYGLSIFVKNLAGSRWLQLSLSGGIWFNFQPSTGSIGSTSASHLAGITTRELGGGWYRIGAHYTWTPASGATSVRLYMVPGGSSGAAASYAGDGASALAVWGAQVDSAGIGVTSYIPTAGSTASRTQDVLSLPLTSLPGWSATQGGALRAVCRLHTMNTGGYNAVPVFVRAADANNSIIMIANWASTGNRRTYVVTGGSFDAVAAAAASPAVFSRSVQAAGWSATRIQQASDGGNLLTGTPAALPVALTTVEFGSYSTHGLNGTLESIAYYRGARPDAFVQAVSR